MYHMHSTEDEKGKYNIFYCNLTQSATWTSLGLPLQVFYHQQKQGLCLSHAAFEADETHPWNTSVIKTFHRLRTGIVGYCNVIRAQFQTKCQRCGLSQRDRSLWLNEQCTQRTSVFTMFIFHSYNKLDNIWCFRQIFRAVDTMGCHKIL